MDTYGDMVTLLLCFFVLLYSMSTIDEKKWQMIVMSFNPNVTSVPAQSIPQGPVGSNSSGGGPGDAPTEDQMEEILEEMYLALDEYIKESNMESSVAVTNGDGYVFLTFRDAVFFGPNSSVLLDEGKDVLREVAPMFLNAQEYIQEIRVMGHTAREIPTQPNSPAFDRTLSANRAAGVGTFLQEQGIDGAKVITVGGLSTTIRVRRAVRITAASRSWSPDWSWRRSCKADFSSMRLWWMMPGRKSRRSGAWTRSKF